VTSPSNETGERRVGRPALRKKGAFTAAERQRRHRQKLRREQRAAEKDAERAARDARWRRDFPSDTARQREDAARYQAEHAEWTRLFERPELPGANGPADDLARQIAEWLMMTNRDLNDDDGVTIEDVRAAIDRQFGPR
jgi:hypothetical protein